MGLTLQNVADATGFPLLQVSRDERGKRDLSVDEIAKYQEFTDGAVRFEDWLDLKRTVEAGAGGMANEAASAVTPAMETSHAG